MGRLVTHVAGVALEEYSVDNVTLPRYGLDRQNMSIDSPPPPRKNRGKSQQAGGGLFIYCGCHLWLFVFTAQPVIDMGEYHLDRGI